jgi:hypothetical protein
MMQDRERRLASASVISGKRSVRSFAGRLLRGGGQHAGHERDEHDSDAKQVNWKREEGEHGLHPTSSSEPEIRLIAIVLCEVPTWRPLTPPIDQKGSPYSRSMNDQPPWSSRPSSNRHFSRATSTFGSGWVTTSAGRGDSMALLVFSAMTKILDFGVGFSHVGYFGGSLRSEAAEAANVLMAPVHG